MSRPWTSKAKLLSRGVRWRGMGRGGSWGVGFQGIIFGGEQDLQFPDISVLSTT